MHNIKTHLKIKDDEWNTLIAWVTENLTFALLSWADM